MQVRADRRRCCEIRTLLEPDRGLVATRNPCHGILQRVNSCTPPAAEATRTCCLLKENSPANQCLQLSDLLLLAFVLGQGHRSRVRLPATEQLVLGPTCQTWRLTNDKPSNACDYGIRETSRELLFRIGGSDSE